MIKLPELELHVGELKPEHVLLHSKVFYKNQICTIIDLLFSNYAREENGEILRISSGVYKIRPLSVFLKKPGDRYEYVLPDEVYVLESGKDELLRVLYDL